VKDEDVFRVASKAGYGRLDPKRGRRSDHKESRGPPQSIAHPTPKPLAKPLTLTGANGKVYGTRTVDMRSGRFVLRCVDGGSRPNHGGFLLYHVKGLMETGLIVTVWTHGSDHTGTTFVYAEGLLSRQSLALLKGLGERHLGRFVM